MWNIVIDWKDRSNMFRILVFLICCYFVSCDISGTTASPSPEPVRIESAPFAAGLVARRGRRVLCGASVLHDKFVITAASCVEGRGWDVSQIKVLVGTNNVSSGGQLHDVEAVIPHERYSEHTGDFNVALLKLKGRLVFGPKVRKVEVGRGDVKRGEVLNVVGWGTNADVAPSSTLRGVTVTVLRKSACRKAFGRIVRARALCAGALAGESRDCVSDEGGPVYQNGTLIGVASPLSGCGRLPGLYTRAAAVRGWVTDTINHHLSYLDYLEDAAIDKRVKNLL